MNILSFDELIRLGYSLSRDEIVDKVHFIEFSRANGIECINFIVNVRDSVEPICYFAVCKVDGKTNDGLVLSPREAYAIADVLHELEEYAHTARGGL